MNPNRGGEYPQDSFEQPALTPEATPDQSEGRVERAAPSENSPSRQSSPPVSVPVANPAVPAPVVAVQSVAVPSDDHGATTPVSASSGDKIEKEWVEKAKKVVGETKGDPFKQKNEMSKVQAAYIEKRFNKKLRTDEVTA